MFKVRKFLVGKIFKLTKMTARWTVQLTHPPFLLSLCFIYVAALLESTPPLPLAPALNATLTAAARFLFQQLETLSSPFLLG